MDWLADRNQQQWLDECGTSADHHLDGLRCQLDDGGIDRPHDIESFQHSKRWDKAGRQQNTLQRANIAFIHAHETDTIPHTETHDTSAN